MQEDDDLLDNVNKVKALVDQLACLKISMRDKDIVITLFENLSMSYEYLITLDTMMMKELTMK